MAQPLDRSVVQGIDRLLGQLDDLLAAHGVQLNGHLELRLDDDFDPSFEPRFLGEIKRVENHGYVFFPEPGVLEAIAEEVLGMSATMSFLVAEVGFDG